MVLEQPGLGLLAPHHAGRDDADERGEIPAIGLGVERAEDRLREGVADDRERGDALTFDRVEEFDRVEVAAGEGDDAAPAAQRAEPGEVAGAVHLRAGRQEPGTGLRCSVARTSSSVPSSASGDAGVAVSLTARSSWRHITPFGMPVVPPV